MNKQSLMKIDREELIDEIFNLLLINMEMKNKEQNLSVEDKRQMIDIFTVFGEIENVDEKLSNKIDTLLSLETINRNKIGFKDCKENVNDIFDVDADAIIYFAKDKFLVNADITNFENKLVSKAGIDFRNDMAKYNLEKGVILDYSEPIILDGYNTHYKKIIKIIVNNFEDISLAFKNTNEYLIKNNLRDILIIENKNIFSLDKKHIKKLINKKINYKIIKNN